jgi:uncharacterized protein
MAQLPDTGRASDFLERLQSWSAQRLDIRAALLVGSFARGAARADSDVDVMLLVQTPESYLGDTTWVQDLGHPRSVAFESYGRVTSVRVFFEHGLEAEVGIAPEDWASEPYDAGTLRVASGGMLVLLDRDGAATSLALHSQAKLTR